MKNNQVCHACVAELEIVENHGRIQGTHPKYRVCCTNEKCTHFIGGSWQPTVRAAWEAWDKECKQGKGHKTERTSKDLLVLVINTIVIASKDLPVINTILGRGNTAEIRPRKDDIVIYEVSRNEKKMVAAAGIEITSRDLPVINTILGRRNTIEIRPRKDDIVIYEVSRKVKKTVAAAG